MRRLLGLSCGNPDGSAEILLKAALMAAEELDVEVRLLRLDDLRIPLNGPPTGPDPAVDDLGFFFEELLEADALVVSAPIYSRSAPGKLRLLADRALGPNADAAFVAELLRLQRAGEPVPVAFRADERVLRPRVAGFLSVGGALPERWRTLALPLMHSLTFSMQIAVADQVQVSGCGLPRTVVLDDAALERAAALGRNVAEQIGLPFEAVEYRGPQGACPLCHLDVLVLRDGGIECATCGAQGAFAVDGERVGVRFDADGLARSVIGLAEKRDHFFEVQETAARQRPQEAEVARRAERFAAYDRAIAPAGTVG